ncbi:VOC family protein [Microbacterium sp. CPCC 204701]|uniref:VOC family protein n=1 Tax=Microbacterium sp. CPCC 204701 TaxID=2493084 RepID=UPI000FD9F96E|nr:VOC family protein [Microbacterium sp. CPCC 204701]
MSVVTGFWHVGLSVADLERSIAFYRDGLGLEVRSRGEISAAGPEVWGAEPVARGDVVFLGFPGGPDVIELLRVSGVPQRDASARPWDRASAHVCFETDDLPALYAHMASLGHRARSQRAVPLPSGVLEGGWAVYFIDPDGFHVEVVERPPAS